MVLLTGRHNRLSRAALVISLALLFSAAQFVPSLAGSALCQMKGAVGHRSTVGNGTHACCCGHTDSQSGLKSRCCEVRENDSGGGQDLAVSLSLNLPSPNTSGIVTESPSDGQTNALTPTRIVDWVQSKRLKEPIYLKNLNFLC